MSNKVRSSVHSLVIIAVLIFSAVGTTIAYADGGTTTGTPPTPTSTSGRTHTTPSGEPQAYASQPAGHKTNRKAKLAALLSQVPSNTNVQVLNANGQAEPLAT